MAYTTMKRYFNPLWLLIIVLVIPGIFGFLVSREKYLYQNEPIASSSPQILPKTSTLDHYLEPQLPLYATGVASWYDYRLKDDTPGEYWSKNHSTCATRGWNRYGKAKVTNLDNGKSVVCYINDDGPRDCEYRYEHGLDRPGECIERIIDLSSYAFSQIADLGAGLVNVKVEEFSPSNK